MKTVLALLCFALSILVAVLGQPALAVISFAASTVILAAPQPRCCVTLVQSPELLLDVIQAFAKQFPAARTIGGQFKKSGLKLNKEYIAHIAGLATAEDVTTTYAVTGTDARTLLSDVNITVNKRKGARLYWQNLDAIKDDKFQYAKVMEGAGYAVGKAFFDDLLTLARSEYFTQSSTYATADSDVDMLIDVTGDMNGVGASGGRTFLVNTPVANALQGDARITSKDYAGFQQGAKPYRMWENTNGFALIQEYPDLPSNNSTALTSVTAEADDDLFTKAAHGLVTGQRVHVTAFTSLVAAGITVGTTYAYVIAVSSSTFKLALTPALAAVGTGVDVTTDGTSGTITPAENLTGFATDLTGINFLAGPEDHIDMDALARAVGAPEIMHFDTVTDPVSGITMSAVSYRDAGTNNLTWMPLLLWGKQAGRKAGTNAVGTFTDYGGHLLRSA